MLMHRGEKSISPDSWVSHPLYDSNTVDYDFALVKLRTMLTWSAFVQPICLPSSTVTV